MTNKEKKRIGYLLGEIIWMARRYADGRYTYAPDMFNDAYDELKNIFGDDLVDRVDKILEPYSHPHATESKWSDLNLNKEK